MRGRGCVSAFESYCVASHMHEGLLGCISHLRQVEQERQKGLGYKSGRYDGSDTGA